MRASQIKEGVAYYHQSPKHRAVSVRRAKRIFMDGGRKMVDVEFMIGKKESSPQSLATFAFHAQREWANGGEIPGLDYEI